MDNRQRIGNDIYWKSVNDRRKNLFENMWPLPYGVSYNSYLIRDEKCALMDTVESGTDDEITVELNETCADAYIKALNLLAEKYNIPSEVSAASFIGNSEMFKVVKTEVDEEAVTEAALSARCGTVRRLP